MTTSSNASGTAMTGYLAFVDRLAVKDFSTKADRRWICRVA